MITRLEQLLQNSRQLRDASKQVYLSGIESFLDFAGRSERRWTPGTVEEWLLALEDVMAPQSANALLCGVKWASRRRHVMDRKSDFAGPIEYLKVTGPVRRPRALGSEEAKKLLATCAAGSVYAECRDRVILLLGLNCGLRREEMCKLAWADLGVRDLLIHGKGGREERVPLDEETIGALKWLGKLRPRPLDAPILQREYLPLKGHVRHLSLSAINGVVAKRAALAGIKVAPHELRHTFGSDVAAVTRDPMQTAKAMRHKDPKTSLGYFHDPAERGDGKPIGDAISKRREDGGNE